MDIQLLKFWIIAVILMVGTEGSELTDEGSGVVIEESELFDNETDVVALEDIQQAFEESLKEFNEAENNLKEGNEMIEDIDDDIKKAREMHTKVRHLKKLSIFFSLTNLTKKRKKQTLQGEKVTSSKQNDRCLT